MKKIFLKALVSSLILGIGAIAVTGCGDNDTVEGDDSADLTFTSIAVTTPPNKTTYVEGESFEKDGMVITGTYNDGTTATISNVRISVTPSGALTVEDTYVTLSYSSLSTTQAITVTEAVPTSLTLVSAPVGTTYPTNGTYDFTGLEVTATLQDESIRTLTSSDYTLTINNTEVYDGGEITFGSGTYTVVLTYKTLSTSFEIKIVDGYLIEAENILFSDNTTGLDNYVRIKMDEYSNYLTEANGNGSIRAVDDDTSSNASGGSYLGDINKGNIIDFYFYSEVESAAEITIRAASGYLLEAVGDTWVPIKMGDAQLNELMSVEINGSPITISDDVILEGGETEDTVNGDGSLWTNWKEVTFGTMTTEVGWNVVSITVTSELTNVYNSNCSFNLDYLSVDYQD